MATTIGVDFNDVETDGRMTCLSEYAEESVHTGDVVILRDGDGNVTKGHVLSLVNDLVEIDVDWGSWNKVNTLLDALEALSAAARGEAVSLDHMFEARPTGLSPKDAPEPKVKITA